MFKARERVDVAVENYAQMRTGQVVADEYAGDNQVEVEKTQDRARCSQYQNPMLWLDPIHLSACQCKLFQIVVFNHHLSKPLPLPTLGFSQVWNRPFYARNTLMLRIGRSHNCKLQIWIMVGFFRFSAFVISKDRWAPIIDKPLTWCGWICRGER